MAEINNRPGANIVFCVLRDPHADMSLTVTARRADLVAVEPPLREGARVIVRAKAEFYTGRGSLSLRAVEFRTVGIGRLLEVLEQRKRLLAAEGLFAADRKRPLPFVPRAVGLITGRGSAAERDVVRNARLRWPAVQFETRNVTVQGPSAATEVLAALTDLDADPDVEVIVIARGGGSVEDLLPFSDEALCRAVFAAKTPIVSAIGHEPDTPLLDYVADVRASTPTDAAKRVVPDFSEEVERLRVTRGRLDTAVRRRIEAESQWLAAVRSRPALANPHSLFAAQSAEVDALRDRARRVLRHRVEAAETDLAHTLARVTALSPHETLRRGYAVVRHGDQVLRSVSEVSPGDVLDIRLADGGVTANVSQPEG